jgi:hypothetical protein
MQAFAAQAEVEHRGSSRSTVLPKFFKLPFFREAGGFGAPPQPPRIRLRLELEEPGNVNSPFPPAERW